MNPEPTDHWYRAAHERHRRDPDLQRARQPSGADPGRARTGRLRVLVVDETRDGTGAVAGPRPRASGAGGGPAPPRAQGSGHVDAFRHVLASDADLVRADLSHGPSYLPALVAAAGTFDVVIGSRYLHGVSGELAAPPHRAQRGGQPLRAGDHGRAGRRRTSGFRCWRRDALGRIPLDRLASTWPPTGTRSSSRHSTRRCAAAPGSARCRSCSSSAGTAARRSR